ncbi:MAG: STAS domain-containing protein [Ignavibacteriaceae bacterium]|nr:STAS domain-containing protein [Ignavibacteriaceae bacterium]
MNFEKEIKEDIVIEKVNLKRATYKEAEEFRIMVQNDIEAGCQKMIIDMKLCEFMDSAFLGVLINSMKLLEKLNGCLKLASVHDDAQVILDITKISDLFKIYSNKEEAVSSFRLN